MKPASSLFRARTLAAGPLGNGDHEKVGVVDTYKDCFSLLMRHMSASGQTISNVSKIVSSQR